MYFWILSLHFCKKKRKKKEQINKPLQVWMQILQFDGNASNKKTKHNIFTPALVLAFADPILILSWRSSGKITSSWKKEGAQWNQGTLWDGLKDKWLAGEWKMQSRCFSHRFLMAARHYWCHYRDLFMASFNPLACPRKEAPRGPEQPLYFRATIWAHFQLTRLICHGVLHGFLCNYSAANSKVRRH